MKLTNREKKFITGGLVMVAIAIAFLLYQSVLPMLKDLRKGEKQIGAEKASLYDLAGKYQALRRYRNIGQEEGNLSAEMESYLNQYSLLNAASLTPSQEDIQGGYQKKIVRISFREVNIATVLQFVKAIENRQGYRIELFQSKALSEKKPGIYSVKIQIATFTRAQ